MAKAAQEHICTSNWRLLNSRGLGLILNLLLYATKVVGAAVEGHRGLAVMFRFGSLQ